MAAAGPLLAALLCCAALAVCRCDRRSSAARSVRALVSGRQLPAAALPGRCPWPVPAASRRQARLCRREPSLPAALAQARASALPACRRAFRHDRWNCSLALPGHSVFDKQFRETAVLQALCGAAVSDAVSRACAQGRLRRCGCPASAASRLLLREAAACPEAAVAAAGRRLARRFLLPPAAARRPADAPEAVLRHNIAVGMQVVEEQLEEACRCHGVSGSCAARTCWRRLAPFPRTVAALRQRYLAARMLSHPNSHRDSRRARNTLGRSGGRLQLLFLDETPPLCGWTRGRRCSDADNCASLCCGRGFRVARETARRACHCRWRGPPPRARLRCRTCRLSRAAYFCQ